MPTTMSCTAARWLTRVGCVRVGGRSHTRSFHLITPTNTKSRLGLVPPSLFSRPQLTTQARMASLDSITQSLASLSINPSASVSHAVASSPAAWREALEASESTPKSFELIKTIVYKPKTAKTATPIPLVVVARENTDVISGALGKKLNLKELRLASEDLLTEFFAVDKHARRYPASLVMRYLTLLQSLSSRSYRKQFFQGYYRPRLNHRGILYRPCRPRSYH